MTSATPFLPRAYICVAIRPRLREDAHVLHQLLVHGIIFTLGPVQTVRDVLLLLELEHQRIHGVVVLQADDRVLRLRKHVVGQLDVCLQRVETSVDVHLISDNATLEKGLSVGQVDCSQQQPHELLGARQLCMLWHSLWPMAT